MTHSWSQRSAAFVVAAALVGAGALVHPVAAQERPPAVVEIASGWVGFADDGIVNEALLGGAMRWYVSPHLSIGPELVYIQGTRHSHAVATGNVTWDLVAGTLRAPRRITPFLAAGGGVFSTRTVFPAETFTSWEGAFTAGGGVRLAVTDRITLGLDARVGWEPHLRVGGVLGIRTGR